MKKWMDVESVLAITGEIVDLKNEVLSLELEMRENEFKYDQMINGNCDFETLIEIAENQHRINMEYTVACDKLATLKSKIERIQLSMND